MGVLFFFKKEQHFLDFERNIYNALPEKNYKVDVINETLLVVGRNHRLSTKQV